MNQEHAIFCVSLLAISLYITYLIFNNSQHGQEKSKNSHDERTDRRDNIVLSEETPLDEYNLKVADYLRLPLTLPPESMLNKLYENNTEDLLKKFIQIKSTCSSIEQSQYNHQFCECSRFNYSKRVPQAIIIGVSKAGTTLMTHLLNEHPFISIPLNEPTFFNDKYWQYSSDLLERYAALMPNSLPNQLTMEKSPGYIYFPYVPERVRPLMGENMKFIVHLRNPVQKDSNNIYYGNISAATKFDRGKYAFYKIGDGPIKVNDESYIHSSRYVEGLSHWLRFYSLDHFHFLAFEDLVKKPLEVLQGLEKFLGVPSWFDEKSFYIDDRERVCYKMTKLAESGDSSMLLKKLESDSLHVTSSYSCNSGMGIYQHYIKEEYMKILQHYFRPYNERLYDLIGINYGW